MIYKKICVRFCVALPPSPFPPTVRKTAYTAMATLDETTMKRDSLLGADQVEDAAAGQKHGPDRIRGVAMPAIIARLSGEERDRLERHLMRKIDFRLLPMIMCMYILNFIDR